MAKGKRRVKRNRRCPVCGELFSAQGLSGHMRWAHGDGKAATQVKPKRSATKAKSLVDMSKFYPVGRSRTPLLVKPRGERLALHERLSECCHAPLISAQAYLNAWVPELADEVICTRCGEWYSLSAELGASNGKPKRLGKPRPLTAEEEAAL